MIENANRAKDIQSITAADDFLNQDGLISREAIKKLGDAGLLKPFYENNNQTEILQSLFDVGYYNERINKVVDLSLMTGIQGGLVIQTLLNFGGERFKKIAKKVSKGELVGGFAVTEEGMSGSAAHKMTTEYSYNKEDKTYNLKTDPEHPKWFQGASMSDFLIVVARNHRTYGIFYVPQKNINSNPIQTAGLNSIRYAKNHFNCNVSEENLLKKIGPREFPELFIRSRLQLTGVNHGITSQILKRYQIVIEEKKLSEKATKELLEMQIRERVSNVLYECVKEYISPQDSVKDVSSLAAIVKTISSKMMQESAEELRRKYGAAGFEKEHFAETISNSVLPFTIFEGSNEMLFSNLTNEMKKYAERLKKFTSDDLIKKIKNLAQDKESNSQIIGEIIAWNFVKQQAITRSLADLSNTKNAVSNYIEMRIQKLLLELDFHKKNKLQAL